MKREILVLNNKEKERFNAQNFYTRRWIHQNFTFSSLTLSLRENWSIDLPFFRPTRNLCIRFVIKYEEEIYLYRKVITCCVMLWTKLDVTSSLGCYYLLIITYYCQYRIVVEISSCSYSSDWLIDWLSIIIDYYRVTATQSMSVSLRLYLTLDD